MNKKLFKLLSSILSNGLEIVVRIPGQNESVDSEDEGEWDSSSEWDASVDDSEDSDDDGEGDDDGLLEEDDDEKDQDWEPPADDLENDKEEEEKERPKRKKDGKYAKKKKKTTKRGGRGLSEYIGMYDELTAAKILSELDDYMTITSLSQALKCSKQAVKDWIVRDLISTAGGPFTNAGNPTANSTLRKFDVFCLMVQGKTGENSDDYKRVVTELLELAEDNANSDTKTKASYYKLFDIIDDGTALVRALDGHADVKLESKYSVLKSKYEEFE